MRSKYIPRVYKSYCEDKKNTITIDMGNLKIPHLNCWYIRKKNDVLNFLTRMDRCHNNGWFEESDPYISYRKVHGTQFWDDDMERILQNPTVIIYRHDDFWPWSTISFFVVRVNLEHAKGFEII